MSLIEAAVAELLAETALRAGANLAGVLHRATRDRSNDPLTYSDVAHLRHDIQKRFEGLTLTPDGVRPSLHSAPTTFLASPDFALFFNHLVVFELAGRTEELLPLAIDELTRAVAVHEAVELADTPALVAIATFIQTIATLVVDNAFSSELALDSPAIQAARDTILESQLTAIEHHLRLLTDCKLSTFATYTEFLQRYQQQALGRHGEIVPPSLEDRRRVPIDDLYVPPTVTPSDDAQAGTGGLGSFSVTDFTKTFDRAVIVGDPGAGKSTLATKVAYELLRGKRLLAPNSAVKLLPLFVVLREYGTHRQHHGGSIVEFIESSVSQKYQLDPPLGVIDWLLSSGRVVTIFDGLDELLDTTYRQEVTASVESFARMYPNAPIMVTTRRVGYREAPLSSALFDLYGIQSFTSTQVAQYVHKWFALDASMTNDDQERLVAAFMSESEIVADLRSNPLMLGLMCTIYRGEKYIPRNRPDVYEKCALMLFERWDKGRGIRSSLPFEAHLRPAMQDLASWIYGNSGRESGVTRSELVVRATSYLQQWRFDSEHEARAAAEEFIDFCRGRAWVFTDTGTRPDGEPLYQFTHGTFLEYFAAAQLARTYRTMKELLKFLTPKIRRAEWDVVAQLAIQIRSKQEEGAAEDALRHFLQAAFRKNASIRSRLNLVGFATRALEFLVPSRSVVREVSYAALQVWLDVVTAPPDPTLINDAQRVVHALADSALENSTTVGAAIVDFIKTLSPDSPHQLCGLGLFATGFGWRKSDIAESWVSAARDEFRSDYERLRGTELWVAIMAVWDGEIRPQELALLHGPSALMKGPAIPGGNSRYFPIADLVLRGLVTRRCDIRPLSLTLMADTLDTVGPALQEGDISKADFEGWHRDSVLNLLSEDDNSKSNRDSDDDHLPWSPERLASGALILAAVLEQDRRSLFTLAELLELDFGHLSFMKTLIRRRFSESSTSDDTSENPVSQTRTWSVLLEWSTGSFLLRRLNP